MDTYSCPHCKQEITAEELDAGAAKHCPHCGKTFSNGEQQETFLPPGPVFAQDRRAAKQVRFLSIISLFLGVYPFINVLIYFLFMYLFFNSEELHEHVFFLRLLFYVLFFGFLTPVLGIITGHVARYKIRRYPQDNSSGKQTFHHLTICYVVLIMVFLSGWGLSELRYAARVASCRNNPTTINTAFKCLGSEFYPQIQVQKGRLVFDNTIGEKEVLGVYEFSEPNTLFCPMDEEGMDIYYQWDLLWRDRKLNADYDMQELINQSSYMYLGYAVTNDKEMRAFADAYKKRIAQGLNFDCDLDVPSGMGTGGGDKILRLRPLDKMMTTLKELGMNPIDAKSIPVMWDRCLLAPDQKQPELYHKKQGIGVFYGYLSGMIKYFMASGNPGISDNTICVLYLDGSVKCMGMDTGEWPLTEGTMRLFWELENL